MIGSISAPVAVSTITSDVSGLVTSRFFGYDNGYCVADSVEPGRGYWVKTDQEARLILQAGEEMRRTSTRLYRIVIRSGSDSPPPPPAEAATSAAAIPKEYGLEQSYPNPFNPTSTMKYALPTDSKVRLTISNILGQVVAVLADGVEQAGYREVNWNANSFASGIYFYRLEATSIREPSITFAQVRKMVLVR